MLAILEFLWYDHQHYLETINTQYVTDTLMPRTVNYTRYTCRCTKCGCIKSFNTN